MPFLISDLQTWWVQDLRLSFAFVVVQGKCRLTPLILLWMYTACVHVHTYALKGLFSAMQSMIQYEHQLDTSSGPLTYG